MGITNSLFYGKRHSQKVARKSQAIRTIHSELTPGLFAENRFASRVFDMGWSSYMTHEYFSPHWQYLLS